MSWVLLIWVGLTAHSATVIKVGNHGECEAMAAAIIREAAPRTVSYKCVSYSYP